MPQGRRKVPFSSKQKKIQLQQRRERKTERSSSDESHFVPGLSSKKVVDNVEVINEQPVSSSHHNPNKYRLMFRKDDPDKFKQKLAMSKQPFEVLPEEELEVSYEDVYAGGVLGIPKRPPWSYSMSKEILDLQERIYFNKYLDDLESQSKGLEVNKYEMNLETWRQLWRVLEFSDIVLLVADIRFTVYHFSPSLYQYVTEDLGKDMILVLNKVDLVPASLVLAWKTYFQQHFPMLKIMCFASYAGMFLKEGKQGQRIGNLRMAVEGARCLQKICEEIVEKGDHKVDLSSWKRKIENEASELNFNGEAYLPTDSEDESSEGKKVSKQPSTDEIEVDTSPDIYLRYRDNTLTIGFVGHPNVGKSSFLNAIIGKKVVSVSKTPGHTKHYQTILLTPTVKLCDCPGLVFPALVPKPIQVLMGCYPISQLREPYSVVSFLCQRVPVQDILKLRYPNTESFYSGEEIKWSSYDICEAWAQKRGFRSAKSGRADVYRAANNILRMALDGRTICLAFYPPNYTKEKEMWSNHPQISEVEAVQAHRRRGSSSSQEASCDLTDLKISDEEDGDDENDESDSEERVSEESDGDASSEPMSENKFGLLSEDVNC